MASIDPFGRTDKLDDNMLAALVTRFEARGKNPRFAKMLGEYLDAMGIDRTARVLDMGCGTGLAARAIARREAFSGHITGVDLSPYLVAAARRLASEERLAEHLEFVAGDVRTLNFADGSFDAVVAHTLLSHVENPLAVLKEAARVVRPGGMIGIFDGDYASLTFDHPDPVRGKAYDEALISALVTNSRVMRQLPRLLQAAGLELVASASYVLSEIGKADFWASAIDAYRKLIAKAGVMTERDANAWAAALQGDSDAGIFFGSSNYYAYVARRPKGAAAS
ncbi:MAG TPA: methyltransferase domain-containing protein [Candidatus Krumholzibacteria bacterium]|nr:methyltransferase domain-containing protein [Candidatus Krumholzibacteria bacterium]